MKNFGFFKDFLNIFFGFFKRIFLIFFNFKFFKKFLIFFYDLIFQGLFNFLYDFLKEFLILENPCKKSEKKPLLNIWTPPSRTKNHYVKKSITKPENQENGKMQLQPFSIHLQQLRIFHFMSWKKENYCGKKGFFFLFFLLPTII